MAKVTVTKTIDGVDKRITINPKYAGKSKKPATIKSASRQFISGGVLWPTDIPYATNNQRRFDGRKVRGR